MAEADPDLDPENTVYLTKRDILARIRDAEEELQNAQRKLDGWKLALEAHRLINYKPERDTPATVVRIAHSRPGPKEAILRVMDEDAEREWTATEIWDRILERGWQPATAKNPRKTIGAQLARMAAKQQLAKVGDATYKLRAPWRETTPRGETERG